MIENTLGYRQGVEISERPADFVVAGDSERNKNPYSQTGKILNKQDAAKKKVRELFRRRVARDAPGYRWSMGYNGLSGRYGNGVQPRMSGSSWNRNKQLTEQNETQDKRSELQRSADDLIKVAQTFARYCARKWRGIPGAFRYFFCWEDIDLRTQFELWFSEQMGGDVFSTGLGIHMLSSRSRGKIKDKATAFFRAASGDRVFCTLTFIDRVGDQAAVSILNKFLTRCRAWNKNFQYFWVAERQENGNIHFHCIFNRRLKVGQYNALWVLCQYNAGLTGKNRYDELVPKETIQALYKQERAEGFKERRIQKLFNPLDIKKIKTIGGLSGYLTKYITKQGQDQPFQCLPWHCSRGVSRIFIRCAVSPSSFAFMKSFKNYRVDKKTGECFQPMEISGAFYVYIFANNKSAPLTWLNELEQVNKWILNDGLKPCVPTIDDEQYRKHFICQRSTNN